MSEDLFASQLEAPEPKSLIGIVPNALHQRGKSVLAFKEFDLAVVEFDDQGLCHERAQMLRITEKLDALAAADEDAILVIYVHGWKHDARSDDSDLRVFATILDQLAYYEIKQAEQQSPPQTPRRVLGVFAAWRGMSLYDNWLHWLENITFWTRQAAALRVSAGSVRELFGHARNYRRNRRKGGRAILAIAGHSFGGKIVYSALEQSLIEAASTPAGKVAPSFADLVLLINPATGSINYLPIKALVDERSNAAAQLPVFVCATAMNDWATSYAFPVGNLFSIITQSWKGPREKEARWYTIGHNPSLKTAEIVGATTDGKPDYTLLPPAPKDKKTANPFWVLQASPDVIDGHGGITQAPFLKFAADLLFAHSDHSAARQADVALHEEAHDRLDLKGFGLP